MKKIFVMLLMLGLIAFSACKRGVIEDPDDLKPAGYHYIVEGAANPSVLYVYRDGYTRDNCEIVVKVSDNQGNPVPGRTVYLEQFHLADFQLGLLSRVDYGYFDSDTTAFTTFKVTDGNGHIKTIYWGPTQLGSQNGVVLRALMADDDQTYTDDLSAPYDYIQITFFENY